MPSLSREPPARCRSSSGTSRRMLSSGPSAATSRPASPVTFLLFGPVPKISPMIWGSWIRLVKPAAPSGRKRPGLLWLDADPALAVPVQVVLALLREELDRAVQARPGPQRLGHREV